MKAVYFLILLVAFVGFAMAKTHHYKVPASEAEQDNSYGGNFIQRAAHGIGDAAQGIAHGFEGFFG